MDGVVAAPESSARSSARIGDLLRAGFDAVLEPLMLIEAVRDDAGRVIDFTFLEVNKAGCQALGVARERLSGRGVKGTLPDFEESGLLQRYADCLATGQAVVLDGYTYLVRSDIRHCDIRAGRTNGEVLTVAWRDVTERVVDERRIAASEQQFRLLAHNIGEAVFRISNDGTILWMSKSAEQTLGPAESRVGHPMHEFLPDDELTGHLARLEAAGRGESVVARGRVVGCDGELHWIQLLLKPFQGAGGGPEGLVLTCRVIDAEVAAEQRVDEARRLQVEADARWRRMMDNAAVGMCLFDGSGRFDVVNHAMCEFFGYDRETLRTLTWQELTAPEHLGADPASGEYLLSGRIDSHRAARQFIHADGHRIWGDLSVSVLCTPDGDFERFIAQITDITAEVEARRELTRRDQQNRALARQLQEQSDRMNAELLSAAAYVASILPGRLEGTVEVTSRHLASLGLAGDCFDYRWIDDDHLIVYLLDVAGHGVQSALLSVSVHNLLRSGSLPAAVLMQPDRVLAELNELFAMDKHAGNYFTMWFGVYQASTRTLRYSSGGHPPALLLSGVQESAAVTELSTPGLPVGMFADTEYGYATVSIAAGDTLLLYSDGAYEIPLPAGQIWSLDNFTAACAELAATADWTLDTLVNVVRARSGAGGLDDDLTLVRLDVG